MSCTIKSMLPLCTQVLNGHSCALAGTSSEMHMALHGGRDLPPSEWPFCPRPMPDRSRRTVGPYFFCPFPASLSRGLEFVRDVSIVRMDRSPYTLTGQRSEDLFEFHFKFTAKKALCVGRGGTTQIVILNRDKACMIDDDSRAHHRPVL